MEKQPMTSKHFDTKANGAARGVGTAQPSVETITPEAAAQYLQRLHPAQRPLREKQVAEYSRSLRAGWKLQGDAIMFDQHGRLMNGQTRLTACVRTAIPFPALVLRNAPEESMGVTDIGGNVRSIEFIVESLGSQVKAPRGTHAAVALELTDFDFYRFRQLGRRETIALWMDTAAETQRTGAILMNAFKKKTGSRAIVAAGIRAWKSNPECLEFLVRALRNDPLNPPQATLLYNALNANRNQNLTQELVFDHAWWVFRVIVAWERNEPLTVLRGPNGDWPTAQRTLAGVRQRVWRAL